MQHAKEFQGQFSLDKGNTPSTHAEWGINRTSSQLRQATRNYIPQLNLTRSHEVDTHIQRRCQIVHVHHIKQAEQTHEQLAHQSLNNKHNGAKGKKVDPASGKSVTTFFSEGASTAKTSTTNATLYSLVSAQDAEKPWRTMGRLPSQPRTQQLSLNHQDGNTETSLQFDLKGCGSEPWK